jgi:hypothetical protein
MCNADSPQTADIIRFVNQKPSATKVRDWYDLLPIQYLAMNKNIGLSELKRIMKEAPAIRAEFE